MEFSGAYPAIHQIYMLAKNQMVLFINEILLHHSLENENGPKINFFLKKQIERLVSFESIKKSTFVRFYNELIRMKSNLKIFVSFHFQWPCLSNK